MKHKACRKSLQFVQNVATCSDHDSDSLYGIGCVTSLSARPTSDHEMTHNVHLTGSA